MHLIYCPGENTWKPAVDSAAVKFEGFESFEFFVARCGYGWRVYEVSTGCAVPESDSNERQVAIDRAREFLVHQGARRLREVIDATLAETGAAKC